METSLVPILTCYVKCQALILIFDSLKGERALPVIRGIRLSIRGSHFLMFRWNPLESLPGIEQLLLLGIEASQEDTFHRFQRLESYVLSFVF